MVSYVYSRNALKFMIITFLIMTSSMMVVSGSNYFEDFEITWGEGRGKILNNGELLTLSLDKDSGSGFESKTEYLFGKIDMQIKLVPGNSAGTVTAYYLSSQGLNHDEIDFEFLGNVSGEPYTVHTNVYTDGKGEKEQQFHLWFDPTSDFHTFSVLWNPQTIVFSVDNTPIREFKNKEKNGVKFPKNQGMKLYSSIWNADQWATRGGLIKTDWTQAPFTASYTNFTANACTLVSTTNNTIGGGAPPGAGGSCASSSADENRPWMSQILDPTAQEKLKSVQKNYMIYNYCTDAKRFPQGFPLECSDI